MSAVRFAIVVRMIAAICAAMIFAMPASAQTCSGVVDTLNFGTVNLAAGTTFDTSGALHVTCRGTPNTTVRVCQNIAAGSGGAASGNNPRYLTDGTNLLHFNIYKDVGHTTIRGSYAGPNTPLQIDLALNASGTGSATTQVFAQIAANQQGLPANIYTSNFAGGQASITYDYAAANTCATIGASHETATPFEVSANDPKTCTLTASPLDFGSFTSTSAPHFGSTTVTATCTSGTAYSISLNSGLNGTSSPMTRAMQFAANLLSYNLYKDSGHSQVWGDTGADIVTGLTGTGSTQTLSVYGAVPIQTTPNPGTYRDFVIVTVTY